MLQSSNCRTIRSFSLNFSKSRTCKVKIPDPFHFLAIIPEQHNQEAFILYALCNNSHPEREIAFRLFHVQEEVPYGEKLFHLESVYAPNAKLGWPIIYHIFQEHE